MLNWTIEAALGSAKLARVILSTDDIEIAEIGRQSGVEVPFIRSAELSQDASAHIDVVLSALEQLKLLDGYIADAVCLLQPTSPFRTAACIDNLLEEACRTRPSALISVCEMSQHPYFARRMDNRGVLHPYVTHNLAYPRKQDLPAAYFINGAIYYNTVASLQTDGTFYPPDCKGWVMPVERSLQIDEPFDLTLANLLLSSQQASPSQAQRST